MSRLFRKPTFRTLAWLVAVLLAICLAWGYSYGRLAPSTWSTPVNYQGDTLEVLAFIKAASEGDYIPCLSQNVSRLGAPFKANWDDNPMYEPFATFVLGLIARWFGLFTATNAGALLGHLTAATAFFVCCRLLRYRLEWASAGALLFGLLFYNSFCTRGGHLLLAFTFAVPFGILTCWLIGASRRIKAGGSIFWLCVVSGFVIGAGNPYNLNMFLQLLCLGVVGHWLFGARRRANLICGGTTFVAAIAGFLAVNLHTLIYWMVHGWNPAPVPRTYAEAEFYALRPLELILPPDVHRFAAMSAIGKYYSVQQPLNHENHSPYLGIVGGAALIWLLLETWGRVLGRRGQAGARTDQRRTTTPRCPAWLRPRRLTAHAPQSLWVLLYAVVAGGNCLLALAGIVYFRGGNRFSIFIAAICLFFLISRMSSIAARWKPVWTYAAAATIALIGILDQLPKPEPVSTETVQKAIRSEQQFARELESRLPRGGMVFQFPAIGFPEGHPVNAMGEYELIRPYLFTRSLRFSFGFNSGRPREMWQHDLGTLTAAQTIEELERYGFSGLFINRKAFTDGAQRLLTDFWALGKTNVIEDANHEQVCFVLNPSPTPEVPHSEDYALVVFKSGWQGYETIWHSTSKPQATAYFLNEGPDDRAFQGSFMVGTAAPGHVGIVVNGTEAGSVEMNGNEARNVKFRVKAKHGRNELVFKTDAPPAVRRGGYFPVTLTVGNLKFTAERSAR
jgi:phosphoglycerol transferase